MTPYKLFIAMAIHPESIPWIHFILGIPESMIISMKGESFHPIGMNDPW